MVDFMKEGLKPNDILAFLLILVYFLLAWQGHDQVLLPSLTLVLGFYFGKEHEKTKNDNL